VYIDYKHTTIKQYHKHGKALRTETTINNTRDFGIGKKKKLTNLSALREVGFSANRRLLSVQRHRPQPDPRRASLHRPAPPRRTDTGHRIAGLRLGDRRAHALLQALLVFRLLPHGFLNRDLRGLLAGLLGKTPTNSAPANRPDSPHNPKLDSIKPTSSALAVYVPSETALGRDGP